MSPNDFGIYVGTIYASYWNPEIGFDGFVKNVILTWESLRSDQDDQMIVTEGTDQSVSIEVPKNVVAKFLIEDIATMDEVAEYMPGVMKPITAKFKASASIEILDVYLTITLKEN